MKGDKIATWSLTTWHLVWDTLVQVHADREMETAAAAPSVPDAAAAPAADSLPAAMSPLPPPSSVSVPSEKGSVLLIAPENSSPGH